MPPKLIRLAYTAEFLLALVAVFTLWSQVGGQVHLDMMPWYWKLPAVAAALATAGLTAALVEGEKLWSVRAVAWLVALVLLGAAMGAVTYYYHLQEENDQEQDTDEGVAMRMGLPLAAGESGVPGIFQERIVR